VLESYLNRIVQTNCPCIRAAASDDPSASRVSLDKPKDIVAGDRDDQADCPADDENVVRVRIRFDHATSELIAVDHNLGRRVDRVSYSSRACDGSSCVSRTNQSESPSPFVAV